MYDREFLCNLFMFYWVLMINILLQIIKTLHKKKLKVTKSFYNKFLPFNNNTSEIKIFSNKSFQ